MGAGSVTEFFTLETKILLPSWHPLEGLTHSLDIYAEVQGTYFKTRFLNGTRCQSRWAAQISWTKSPTRKKHTRPHHTHILGMLLIISQHFLVFLICNFHYNYPKSIPHFLSENNNQNQHVYTSLWKPLLKKRAYLQDTLQKHNYSC